MENAEKCKKEAADRGKSRKEKLERLFGNNKYVQMFYANYTFEVDFTNIEKNRSYYKQVIEENYQKDDTIKKHKDCIEESEAKRYDTVISVANYSLTEQNKILKLFCTKFPETMLSKLVKYMEENGDR